MCVSRQEENTSLGQSLASNISVLKTDYKSILMHSFSQNKRDYIQMRVLCTELWKTSVCVNMQKVQECVLYVADMQICSCFLIQAAVYLTVPEIVETKILIEQNKSTCYQKSMYCCKCPPLLQHIQMKSLICSFRFLITIIRNDIQLCSGSDISDRRRIVLHNHFCFRGFLLLSINIAGSNCDHGGLSHKSC